MEHIILTQKQANAVKGKHGDHSFLDPYLVQKNGETKLGLPVAVLSDTEYADICEVLSKLPIEDGWEYKEIETEEQ